MEISKPTMLSDEEFLELSDENVGKQELLNGELIELPPAKRYHGLIAKEIYERFRAVIHESRVWIEMGYRMRRGRWMVPDVSVMFPDQMVADGWYQGSPMLVVEIASRGNRVGVLEAKTKLYLEHGAVEVWILYPETRTILVSRVSDVRRIFEGETYFCEALDFSLQSDFWVSVE